MEKLKKILKVFLYVIVVIFGVYFLTIYRIATKNIGRFEEKTLFYDLQSETFFVEHLGEQIKVDVVVNGLCSEARMIPYIKVYYFEHNITDNVFFSSGIEIFSGEYTPEELKTLVLKNKQMELLYNCFMTCVFAFCFYVLCTLVYIIVSEKFILKL